MAPSGTSLSRESIGRYPWVAMAVILGGSYMMVVDTTVLGVALPDIGRDLTTSGGLGIDWIVTAYLVAVGAVQPATGWLADTLGKKRTYLWSMGLFVAGSALAGLAPSMEVLVLARVLQGAGGGAMQPVGMAMIYELFPVERRGTALGIWGVAIMAAPAVGPPLGGWVTTTASWRWIFLINIPVGLVVLVLGKKLLREKGTTQHRALDVRGWAAAAFGLVALVITLREASGWGLTSARTFTGIVVATTLLVWLVRRSVRLGDDALIDFSMFRIRTFSITMGIVALLTFTQFGRLTYFPVELQYTRGLGADEVGLLLVPSAIAVAITMPLGGWLADRIGSRLPVAIGLSLVASGAWFLGHLSVTTSTSTIILLLVISGLGSGLAIMPNSVAALNSLPASRITQGAAVRSINRQVAGAAGTAILAAVLVASLGAVSPERLADPPSVEAAQAAYNLVFIVSFWALAAAAVLALFLPGRGGMAELHRLRREEEDAAADDATYIEV